MSNRAGGSHRDEMRVRHPYTYGFRFKPTPKLHRVPRDDVHHRSRSGGWFRELIREALRMRLERPTKYPADRESGGPGKAWRQARNKRKAAAQRARGAR